MAKLGLGLGVNSWRDGLMGLGGCADREKWRDRAALVAIRMRPTHPRKQPSYLPIPTQIISYSLNSSAALAFCIFL